MFIRCFNIKLHGSCQVSYLLIPLPSLVHGYEGEWFYMQNIRGSAPQFTDRIIVSKPEWSYGAEKKFNPKIEYMLEAIAK